MRIEKKRLNLSRTFRWILFSAAFVGLGIAMPSCPGQQAMQQQVETLSSKVNETVKLLHSHESQMKQLGTEVSQLRSVLSQLNNIVGAQKLAMEALEAKSNSTPKSAPKKASGKKKH